MMLSTVSFISLFSDESLEDSLDDASEEEVGVIMLLLVELCWMVLELERLMLPGSFELPID